MPDSSHQPTSPLFHLIDASMSIANARTEMASRETTWLGVFQQGVLVGIVDDEQLREADESQTATVGALLERRTPQVRWAA